MLDADRGGQGGAPEPPASTERPKTYSVRSPMTSMSASPVFMSELVRKVPPNDATRSPVAEEERATAIPAREAPEPR